MGCGKTTAARKLARRLGARFVDTDAAVEEREGASVADIFGYGGEEYFRRAERCVLEDAARSAENTVVSTGGGLPARGDNMEFMKRCGRTVYLRRPAAQIASRLSPYGRMKRPRLRGLNDVEIVEFMSRDMAAREPFYAAADLTVECADRSDEEILSIIEHWVHGDE